VVLLRFCFGALAENDENNFSGFDVPEYFEERNALGLKNYLWL
jgi:hypothetical protein